MKNWKSETKSKKVENKCNKISQFVPNVNEQLNDPTSIQSLINDNQAVEAMNLESTAEQRVFAFVFAVLSVLLIIFSVLLLFVPSMKQCENFMLCSTF